MDTNIRSSISPLEAGIQWIPASDPRFTINGLPWFAENQGAFVRLPKRAQGVVRDVVWDLGTMPSGGRVRFKTDSTNLKLRIQHSRPEIAMTNMCAVGVSGIDLYEGPPSKMRYWKSSQPTQPKSTYVWDYFTKLPRQLREFTLYLPVHNDLVLLEIGIDAGAVIQPPTPFRLAKPVVFYGMSITQGACSARPATGYVPTAGRQMGIDVVNLGFAGNGKCDLELIDFIAGLDMACFVNDCVPNMKMEEMQARYASFHEKIRARHPDLPILLMTSFGWAQDNYIPGWCDAQNALAVATWKQFRDHGDKNMHLLDCREIIGLESDHPSVDGVHLTDLGFKRLADAVAAVLQRILNLL